MAFLSQQQLEAIGFKSLGKNVLISDKASIYGAEHISIGDNSRIDDFCILSAGEGGIDIGKHVHIGCYSSLIGKASINIGDYSGLSSRVSIYSSSDNYDGEFMTNPTIPEPYRNTTHDLVLIGDSSVIGSGCVVLPGVVIWKGCAFGALSLIKGVYLGNQIYAGVPATWRKQRESKHLELSKEMEAANEQTTN